MAYSFINYAVFISSFIYVYFKSSLARKILLFAFADALPNMLSRPIAASSRRLATVATGNAAAVKKEGDISDAFVSLSGAKRDPLPDRFRQLKCDLVRGREREVTQSWTRLLRALREENDYIAAKGSDVIPQIEYKHLDKGIDELRGEILKRGAVVVRGVVPEEEARAYKEEVQVSCVVSGLWNEANDCSVPAT